MKKNYLLLFVLYFVAHGLSQAQPVITWNGYKISYIGRTSFYKGLDTKDVNAKLQILNVSNPSPVPIYFQIYIEGLTAENHARDNHGDGGFAVFPNGGALLIKQGEKAFTQNWLSGVYETRFGNIPPATGKTNVYKFHFLYSESGDALNATGFPKDNALVGDLPVTLEFTNTENTIDTQNGNLKINIEVTTDNLHPFYVGLGTELSGFQNDMFNTLRVQDGNSNKPFKFQANVKSRNDWLVKISQAGKNTEIISVDTTNPNISLTLKPSTHGLSPYDFTLLKSVKTPTGFWRGAVSESEGTFIAIPGQENWRETANPKTASKIFKYTFDGNLLWDFDLEWEAWGGDMSEDGKVVAVASNNPEGSGTYNPSGGQYLLVIDGKTGNLMDNIPGIETKSLKVSHDGKFIAIGLQWGNFHIYDVANKHLFINVGGKDYYGQIREMLWNNNNSALYVSSGDGYLRKYSLNLKDPVNATETWAGYVGGWAFVNGLNLSTDFNYIAVGSKDKGQTVLNTKDGHVLWSKHTGNFDSKISNDGSKVVTFGGKVFDLLNGNLTGFLGRLATTHFFHNSHFILSVDRVRIEREQVQNGITVHSPEGDLLNNKNGENRFYDPNDLQYSGGEQVQWSYLSADDSRLIVLSRDMDTSGEVGISVFSVVDNGSSPQGIENTPIFSDFVRFYPNPAGETLNFLISNTHLNDIRSIRILDMNGREIKNIYAFSPRMSMDINDLTAGIYFVNVQTSTGNYSTKLIKR